MDAGEVIRGIYTIYTRFGDGLRACLVEVVDAVVKNGMGNDGSVR